MFYRSLVFFRAQLEGSRNGCRPIVCTEKTTLDLVLSFVWFFKISDCFGDSGCIWKPVLTNISQGLSKRTLTALPTDKVVLLTCADTGNCYAGYLSDQLHFFHLVCRTRWHRLLQNRFPVTHLHCVSSTIWQSFPWRSVQMPLGLRKSFGLTSFLSSTSHFVLSRSYTSERKSGSGRATCQSFLN